MTIIFQIMDWWDLILTRWANCTLHQRQIFFRGAIRILAITFFFFDPQIYDLQPGPLRLPGNRRRPVRTTRWAWVQKLSTICSATDTGFSPVIDRTPAVLPPHYDLLNVPFFGYKVKLIEEMGVRSRRPGSVANHKARLDCMAKSKPVFWAPHSLISFFFRSV